MDRLMSNKNSITWSSKHCKKDFHSADCMYTFFSPTALESMLNWVPSHQGCICHMLFRSCCLTLHVRANPCAESIPCRRGMAGSGGVRVGLVLHLGLHRAAALLPSRCHHMLYEPCSSRPHNIASVGNAPTSSAFPTQLSRKGWSPEILT